MSTIILLDAGPLGMLCNPNATDADVILAAQATILSQSNDTVIVATTNVGHLSRMVTAYT